MKMLKGITKGLPQTGIQGGAGVGVFYIHRMLASKVAFLQNKPLAIPLGLIVLGHALKKKPKLANAGSAIIGAGGYAAAQIFEVRKAMQVQAPVAQTAGVYDDDTGALVQANDIGALIGSGDIGEVENNNAYDDAYADAYAL